LSARVGSIADNRSGGWYAYRASKAALNMMIRTLAVEWMRLPRPIGCFALHPGTVATNLSAPFSQNLSTKQVFNTDEAAAKLLYVLHSLSAEHSGGFFAYDGSRIAW
jgi:NAD(P)-dependent dehydrogenase (short-subunit alcohol dehydrogenase family)